MRDILFLGGGGLLSDAVSRRLSELGDRVTVITRSPLKRPAPDGVRQTLGDVTDPAQLVAIVGTGEFDAVVNWVAYTPPDFADHIELFEGRIGQYVLISTCSVFARPAALPITESSARRQPVFAYANGKLACELAAETAFRDSGFPATIIRPFHTYDATTPPLLTGDTAMERLRRGQPVVVPGDGTSLWSLTHATDFARACEPLLADSRITGESVNVVNDQPLTWDQIHTELATALGSRRPNLIHVSSQTIGTKSVRLGEVLEHDFRHSMTFDTSKLHRLVPGWTPRVSFAQGAREIAAQFGRESRAIDPEIAVMMEEFFTTMARNTQ